MTVNIETTKISYIHNGSQTVYTYPFWILANDDIKVYVLDSAGAITTLTLNTHYTVTGAGVAAGGTIVLTSASTVATNATITLLSNIEITQPTDYVDGETFTANSLEAVLDKQTRILQQQNEKLDRTVRMPAGSANLAEFPTSSKASKILGFDSTGAPALLAFPSSGYAASASATPDTVILRDSGGRAKVGTPIAADDIMRKDAMDTAIAVAIAALPSTAFRGALVFDTPTLNLTTGYQALAWNNELYDTNSIHSISVNQSRLTVPAGVTKIRLSCNFIISFTGTAGTHIIATIFRNDSNAWGGVPTVYLPTNGAGASYVSANLSTPIINAAPGDYFDVRVVQSNASVGGQVSTAWTNENWFNMEIIE